MDIAQVLLAIEEELWRAAGARDRYAAHLAADAVHIFPGWGVADRQAVLAGVADAQPWQSFQIADPEVIRLSDEAAALVYRARARRGAEAPYEAAITSVYRREGTAWKLVLHQQTPLSTA
jgi:ketosteroid isomerase-like protein